MEPRPLGLRNPELREKDRFFLDLLAPHFESDKTVKMAEILTDVEEINRDITEGRGSIAVAVVKYPDRGKTLAVRAFIEESDEHADLVRGFEEAESEDRATHLMLDAFFQSSSMEEPNFRMVAAISDLSPKIYPNGPLEEAIIEVGVFRLSRNHDYNVNRGKMHEAILTGRNFGEQKPEVQILYS